MTATSSNHPSGHKSSTVGNIMIGTMIDPAQSSIGSAVGQGETAIVRKSVSRIRRVASNPDMMSNFSFPELYTSRNATSSLSISPSNDTTLVSSGTITQSELVDSTPIPPISNACVSETITSHIGTSPLSVSPSNDLMVISNGIATHPGPANPTPTPSIAPPYMFSHSHEEGQAWMSMRKSQHEVRDVLKRVDRRMTAPLGPTGGLRRGVQATVPPTQSLHSPMTIHRGPPTDPPSLRYIPMPVVEGPPQHFGYPSHVDAGAVRDFVNQRPQTVSYASVLGSGSANSRPGVMSVEHSTYDSKPSVEDLGEDVQMLVIHGPNIHPFNVPLATQQQWHNLWKHYPLHPNFGVVAVYSCQKWSYRATPDGLARWVSELLETRVGILKWGDTWDWGRSPDLFHNLARLLVDSNTGAEKTGKQRAETLEETRGLLVNRVRDGSSLGPVLLQGLTRITGYSPSPPTTGYRSIRGSGSVWMIWNGSDVLPRWSETTRHEARECWLALVTDRLDLLKTWQNRYGTERMRVLIRRESQEGRSKGFLAPQLPSTVTADLKPVLSGPSVVGTIAQDTTTHSPRIDPVLSHQTADDSVLAQRNALLDDAHHPTTNTKPSEGASYEPPQSVTRIMTEGSYSHRLQKLRDTERLALTQQVNLPHEDQSLHVTRRSPANSPASDTDEGAKIFTPEVSVAEVTQADMRSFPRIPSTWVPAKGAKPPIPLDQFDEWLKARSQRAALAHAATKADPARKAKLRVAEPVGRKGIPGATWVEEETPASRRKRKRKGKADESGGQGKSESIWAQFIALAPPPPEEEISNEAFPEGWDPHMTRQKLLEPPLAAKFLEGTEVSAEMGEDWDTVVSKANRKATTYPHANYTGKRLVAPNPDNSIGTPFREIAGPKIRSMTENVRYCVVFLYVGYRRDNGEILQHNLHVYYQPDHLKVNAYHLARLGQGLALLHIDKMNVQVCRRARQTGVEVQVQRGARKTTELFNNWLTTQTFDQKVDKFLLEAPNEPLRCRGGYYTLAADRKFLEHPKALIPLLDTAWQDGLDYWVKHFFVHYTESGEQIGIPSSMQKGLLSSLDQTTSQGHTTGSSHTTGGPTSTEEPFKYSVEQEDGWTLFGTIDRNYNRETFPQQIERKHVRTPHNLVVNHNVRHRHNLANLPSPQFGHNKEIAAAFRLWVSEPVAVLGFFRAYSPVTVGVWTSRRDVYVFYQSENLQVPEKSIRKLKDDYLDGDRKDWMNVIQRAIHRTGVVMHTRYAARMVPTTFFGWSNTRSRQKSRWGLKFNGQMFSDVWVSGGTIALFEKPMFMGRAVNDDLNAECLAGMQNAWDQAAETYVKHFWVGIDDNGDAFEM